MSRDRRFRLAGIGACVADQVFVIRDGIARYHATRGGGSVWNTLAHLARTGHDCRAYASAGDDGAGHLARRDLERSGVDTTHVRLTEGRQTRVFTHYVHDDPQTCEGYPHRAFFTDCPVCGRAADRSRLTAYTHDDFATALEGDAFDFLCADHLDAQSAHTAARFPAAVTVLDLANYRDLARVSFETFTEWHRAFRIIFMPQQFAQLFRHEFAFDFVSEALRGAQVDLLVIGKGKRGAEIHGRAASGDLVHLDIPAPRVRHLVDTAGAGDAMLAALLDCVMRQTGFLLHDGRIRIDPQHRAAITEAVHQAVTPVLQGIGARATLPAPDAGDGHLAVLQSLRGRTVDELKLLNAGNARCLLCGL